MKHICVFTGSRPGARPEFAENARAFADALLERGLGLVYGGSSIGLMGIIADRVLQGGGEVIGVIPQALKVEEIAHRGLTELHVVDSMHERKLLMAERSQGFVALPGGFGTLDELFEVVTWRQIGLHEKPIGVLNFAGYYDALLAFVDHATDEAFITPALRDMLSVAVDPGALLDAMGSRPT